ncbi:SubName: Full=Uncharacterized protein {ECO:0000313/EMBL:CCA70070.1} [Serendipita indica DSM 11827]|uniref:ACB domain-containing protein n=1 Tax=Serendipita indica (strain DSM 11827) TaxID=1109443 RepID=G4TFI9_SERID|nr:SubName: Full=Uncharacterized protein {ECO:0000313/EMBL:CCA70070.1} [Serendipita indica DSM 11827]CCA70070.1 hypothetical protein PIIN_04010 [Serendipita indica DSM 11827]
MSSKVFTPSPQFHNAAAFVSTAPELGKAPNHVKLELYALYKMVTVSRKPNTPRPSFIDIRGKAKWDAWDKMGKELEDQSLEQIQDQYLDRCKSLGWNPSQQANSTIQVSTTNEVDVHDIDWDAEYDPKTDEGSRRGGQGMGTKVSVLAGDEQETDAKTLHGLAILGDAEKLDTLLQLDPHMDINQKDEYGYTALHLAADRGNVRVVELLLRKGADSSIKDADDLSALELAEASGNEQIAALLQAS